MKPPLFVPVENQVRELDAKLLFACVAAASGFPVILGFKHYLHFEIPKLGRGIYIAKSMRARSALMFNLIRDLGNELVAWDEESLVRYSSPEYFPWRFSESTFKPVSHLFAWGTDDAEMFRAYSGNHGVPVHTTGNPRADLLRRDVRRYFDAEVQILRDRFGDFVLVNTNFSFVNPFLKQKALVLPANANGRRKESRTAHGMSAAFAAGMAAHQQAIFDHFRELLPRLGKRFPQTAIIVRPHPSEDHAVWREIVGEQPNIRVIHEGNVIPWLMACQVLLHNGCTTAVEGTVLDRPAVTFQPVQSDIFDYELPNSLSHRAYTVDDVLEAVASILGGHRGMIAEPERQKIFARHLAGVSGPLSSERIVSVLTAAGYDSDDLRPKSAWRFAAAKLTSTTRTTIKRFNMRRRDHWASDRYHSHVFPDISVAEINHRIERIGHVLGRFEGVTAERTSPHLFRIANDDARTAA